MKEFHILLRSGSQVQSFVNISMRQPFEIRVGNEGQDINGKDLMGMFSLDYSAPIRVRVQCSQEEFLAFRQCAREYLV